MRAGAKIVAVSLMVVVLSGCAALTSYVPFYKPGPDKIGKATHVYCGLFTPERRAGFRKTANAHAHPHEIMIICDGDNSTNEER